MSAAALPRSISCCPTLTESGYVGIALGTVARIAFVDHGGRILVSRTTWMR
jgi:hypothetical protein